MSSLTFIFLLVLVYATGAWLIKKNHAEWETREFARFAGQWDLIYLVSIGISAIAGVIAGLITSSPIVFFMVAVASLSLAFTGWTDLFTRRAPIEMQHLAIVVLLPVAVIGMLNPALLPVQAQFAYGLGVHEGAYHFAYFSLLLPIVLYVLGWLTGGIGLADVRAMWIIAFAFAWWYGFQPLFIFAMVSIVVQILAAIPARIFNWGEMMRAPFPGVRRSINKVYRKVSKKDKDLVGYQARAIPWLPAISATFIVLPLFFM